MLFCVRRVWSNEVAAVVDVDVSAGAMVNALAARSRQRDAGGQLFPHQLQLPCLQPAAAMCSAGGVRGDAAGEMRPGLMALGLRVVHSGGFAAWGGIDAVHIARSAL